MEHNNNTTGAKRMPKAPPKKQKTKASQLSEEQFKLLLRKKMQCIARAQKIVEDAINILDPEKIACFLRNLNYIDHRYYVDITVERAISKICGYPLCLDELGEQPKQQYKISLVNKKVYDITERKNFCSTICYKASSYLKEQIPTSMLWMRGVNDMIDDFKLMDIGSKKATAAKNLANHMEKGCKISDNKADEKTNTESNEETNKEIDKESNKESDKESNKKNVQKIDNDIDTSKESDGKANKEHNNNDNKESDDETSKKSNDDGGKESNDKANKANDEKAAKSTDEQKCHETSTESSNAKPQTC